MGWSIATKRSLALANICVRFSIGSGSHCQEQKEINSDCADNYGRSRRDVYATGIA